MSLQVKNIEKSYYYGKNKQSVINSLTIKFNNTGLIGITGKSGSGKSTLLNIIAGIEKPNNGNIIIDGHILDYRYLSDYRKKYISYVYQFYNLIDALTVKENIDLISCIKGTNNDKVNKYLKELKLEAHLSKYPTMLSGGQKQRVGLLRAFVSDTPILLADEPTGAVNEELSIEIMKALKTYSKNHLVIIISHNQELLKKYTHNIIDFDNIQPYYDFETNKYHTYKLKTTKTKNILFYTFKQLKYQKNKIMMMLISQIFIIISFILLISASNGYWTYLQKTYECNPLKQTIELTKTDYYNSSFTQEELNNLKKDQLITNINYNLDLSNGYFTKKKQFFQTHLIKNHKYLHYQNGQYPKNNNEILINRKLADKYHIYCNDTISYFEENNKIDFKVVGIIDDYINDDYNIYIDEKYLENKFKEKHLDNNLLILQSKDVTKTINNYQDNYLMINYHQEYIKSYKSLFNMAMYVITTFITVSFIISLILIFIILKTIFIERKRDTSILLANGLTNRKVARLFYFESSLMGLLVGIIGSVISEVVLIIVNITNISEQMFNIRNVFILPKIFFTKYDLYLVLIFIYMITCLLAGVIASKNIHKMDISILLKEE